MRRAVFLVLLLPLCAAAETPREAVMRADRELCKAATARDRAAFAALVADDVATFGSGPAKERGKMVENWAPFFTPGGMTVTWEPESAEVSGDLGYTIGTYRLTREGKTGAGSYVTVWRLGKDGRWRVAVDIGTAPTPVTAPPAPSRPQ